MRVCQTPKSSLLRLLFAKRIIAVRNIYLAPRPASRRVPLFCCCHFFVLKRRRRTPADAQSLGQRKGCQCHQHSNSRHADDRLCKSMGVRVDAMMAPLRRALRHFAMLKCRCCFDMSDIRVARRQRKRDIAARAADLFFALLPAALLLRWMLRRRHSTCCARMPIATARTPAAARLMLTLPASSSPILLA